MKRLLLTFLSFIPRALPVGMTQFETWAKRIITISGPFADEDSMKFALASQVLHLDHKVKNVPDSYFVAGLHKAAANQVASQIFQDIKIRQQEAAKAKVEATTITVEASNASTAQN